MSEQDDALGFFIDLVKEFFMSTGSSETFKMGSSNAVNSFFHSLPWGFT